MGGFLYGSETNFQISELCCLAVINRGQFIWNIIWRYITTTGVSYSADLEKEITNIFTECFKDVDDIKKQILSIPSLRMGHESTVEPWMMDSFSEAHSDTVDKIYSEIELFVISLKKKETKKEKSPTVMNFYSPVGAVKQGQTLLPILHKTSVQRLRMQLIPPLIY